MEFQDSWAVLRVAANKRKYQESGENSKQKQPTTALWVNLEFTYSSDLVQISFKMSRLIIVFVLLQLTERKVLFAKKNVPISNQFHLERKKVKRGKKDSCLVAKALLTYPSFYSRILKYWFGWKWRRRGGDFHQRLLTWSFSCSHSQIWNRLFRFVCWTNNNNNNTSLLSSWTAF